MFHSRRMQSQIRQSPFLRLKSRYHMSRPPSYVMCGALVDSLQFDLSSLVGAEDDSGGQASDRLVVLGVHVRKNSVFALASGLAKYHKQIRRIVTLSRWGSPWAARPSWSV